MVHRRPQDRQSDGDRDRPVEVEGLGGDVSLVVVLGQHPVEAAHESLVEDRVGRNRPGHVESLLAGRVARGGDVFDLLVAECTVLATVGLSAATASRGFSTPNTSSAVWALRMESWIRSLVSWSIALRRETCRVVKKILRW